MGILKKKLYVCDLFHFSNIIFVSTYKFKEQKYLKIKHLSSMKRMGLEQLFIIKKIFMLFIGIIIKMQLGKQNVAIVIPLMVVFKKI